MIAAGWPAHSACQRRRSRPVAEQRAGRTASRHIPRLRSHGLGTSSTQADGGGRDRRRLDAVDGLVMLASPVTPGPWQCLADDDVLTGGVDRPGGDDSAAGRVDVRGDGEVLLRQRHGERRRLAAIPGTSRIRRFRRAPLQSRARRGSCIHFGGERAPPSAFSRHGGGCSNSRLVPAVTLRSRARPERNARRESDRVRRAPHVGRESACPFAVTRGATRPTLSRAGPRS